MPIKFDIAPNHPHSDKIIAATAELERKRMDRGLMGAFFGSDKNLQKGNITGFSLIVAAAILIALTIVLTLLLIFGSDSAGFSKKDQVLLIVTLITTTLGFLFGRTTSS